MQKRQDIVDTSAWYALEVEDDVNHDSACKFLPQIASGKHGIAITTDCILDETLTLLHSRRGLVAAATFIEKVKKSKSVQVFWINEDLFEKALGIFLKSEHKSWSFTDCKRFALTKELSVSETFSFDNRFREAAL